MPISPNLSNIQFHHLYTTHRWHLVSQSVPSPNKLHWVFYYGIRFLLVLKSPWVISHVNVELTDNISEIHLISIISADVVNNDNMSLTYIAVCQISDSSYWCTMQEGVVKLRGLPSKSDLSPCHLTWWPRCQICCFLFSILFSVCSRDFCDIRVLECLNPLVLVILAFLSLNPSSLCILSACNFISIASLTGQSM